MLVAHEFAHVAQAGLLGHPDFLPFFAIEGGAEYFASLVVGPEQKNLAGRFREAVADERAGRTVPLRELIAEPREDDRARVAASYARGYAAMRFLTARWGTESFTRLHRDNVDGDPERFLGAMARLTGLSLDDFDRELAAYLIAQTSTTATVGRATLAPNSMLADLVTARPLGATNAEPVDRFARSDAAVLILFTWECLPRAIRGEARVIAPDGGLFTTFSGTSGPGCDVDNYIELRLDREINGRAPRSLPGTWRVEIYADGVLQGSVAFDVE
jgi:hypothetical protein